MTHPSIRPVPDADLITPSSDTGLDRHLVERLRTLGEPGTADDECFEPLGGIAMEAALWVSAAAILWIFVAVCSA